MEMQWLQANLTIPNDLLSDWLVSFKTSIHRYIILYCFHNWQLLFFFRFLPLTFLYTLSNLLRINLITIRTSYKNTKTKMPNFCLFHSEINYSNLIKIVPKTLHIAFPFLFYTHHWKISNFIAKFYEIIISFSKKFHAKILPFISPSPTNFQSSKSNNTVSPL